MFDGPGIAKLVGRYVHIGSGVLLLGNSIADGIWGGREGKGYTLTLIICGFLLLISGITNLILLKPSKTMDNLKKPWVSMIYLKFFLWVLYLPIFEKVIPEFPRKSFNLVLSIVVILVSSATKQYRDWASNKIKSE